MGRVGTSVLGWAYVKRVPLSFDFNIPLLFSVSNNVCTPECRSRWKLKFYEEESAGAPEIRRTTTEGADDGGGSAWLCVSSRDVDVCAAGWVYGVFN